VGHALRRPRRAILRALAARAYAPSLRRLAGLSVDRRLHILEGWRTGGYLRRSALRALLSPLKMSHFDDPAFFRQLGCVYGAEPATDERPRWRERVLPLTHDEEIECDVVVVDTDAAAAVLP